MLSYKLLDAKVVKVQPFKSDRVVTGPDLRGTRQLHHDVPGDRSLGRILGLIQEIVGCHRPRIPLLVERSERIRARHELPLQRVLHTRNEIVQVHLVVHVIGAR